MVANAQPQIAPFDQLTDAELRRHEIVVPRQSRRVEAFVPSFPVLILGAVVAARAEKALPLILAVHRQLNMTHREWTPINAAVWRAAGNPSDKRRSAIIRMLERLPALICIEPHRTPSSHYRAAKGPQWARKAAEPCDFTFGIERTRSHGIGVKG